MTTLGAFVPTATVPVQIFLLKIIGGNRGEMGRTFVTQDAAHKGYC